MTLAEVRSRGHEAALDVAERLRSNARSADRLPFEVRRDVLDLVLRGYPQHQVEGAGRGAGGGPMIREVTMYRVECDWPGCTASAQDDSEHYAWSDKDGAIEDATDANWRLSRAGLCHYCPGHLSVWASDHENGERLPEPPYLLIHDGDTDRYEDDGTVTFVGAT